MTKLPALFKNSRSLADVENLFTTMNSAFLDFDRMFDRFDRLFPTSIRAATFPPVDIIKTDTGYDIILAVAGYTKDDLTVELDDDHILTVTGKQEQKQDMPFLFKGIASRQFTRRWQLLEEDEVADVKLANGLLTIKIKRTVVEPQVKRLTINVE